MARVTSSEPRTALCLHLIFLFLTGCAPRGLAGAREECPAPLPGLVDVRALDPSIRVDLRYATPDNFTGAPLPGYRSGRALLRPDAGAALARVQRHLRAEGLGLKVWDAYRPVRATRAMVEWARRTGSLWVIEQGYVAERSGHNRGATVDLTLVTLEGGAELDMGTKYDTFSEAAHTSNAQGAARENRERLVRAMVAEGWTNYPLEWWHFSFAAEHEPLDVPLACFSRSFDVALPLLHALHGGRRPHPAARLGRAGRRAA